MTNTAPPNPLLTPLTLGDLTLKNRILLAPLTRARSNREGLANALMAEYYAQRAGAGLLISEATAISPEGHGWPNAPGLWTREQAESWQQVTAAVHAKGGLIIAQLWHMGRLTHSSLHGLQPVSASATLADGEAHTYDGKAPFEPARALALDEIPRLLADYENAARMAKLAGFDGVQLHGANGYLIDQFLRDSTNQRTDDYGGSIANRTRLLREVTQVLINVWGAGGVSVRLSPNDDSNGAQDTDKRALFNHAAAVLNELDIAFLELRDPAVNGSLANGPDPEATPRAGPRLRQHFKGPLVSNGAYTADEAAQALTAGEADAIAWGRAYITNPDLAERIAAGQPWAAFDFDPSWITGEAAGYTSYPNYQA